MEEKQGSVILKMARGREMGALHAWKAAAAAARLQRERLQLCVRRLQGRQLHAAMAGWEAAVAARSAKQETARNCIQVPAPPCRRCQCSYVPV